MSRIILSVYPPFDAAQYLQNLARNGLGGATATDIRPDESLQAVIAKISEMSNATAQQYGTGINQIIFLRTSEMQSTRDEWNGCD